MTMPRALFRNLLFQVTADAAIRPDLSNEMLHLSDGMITPNRPRYVANIQRIDSIAAATQGFSLPASAIITFSASDAGLNPDQRVLLRLSAKTHFTVEIDPGNGEEVFEVSISGTQYQPGLFEVHLKSFSTITFINDGDEVAAFQGMLAAIVDYDDPRLGGLIPANPIPGDSVNSNMPAGLMFIGQIFPVMGVYTGANNSGSYSEALVTPLADWAKYCDGSLINDVASPLFGFFVPDISDDRFIMGAGSTAAGMLSTVGNTRDLTHTHVGATSGLASVNTTTRTADVTATVAIPAKVFASGNNSVNTTTRTVNVAITNHVVTQPTFTANAHTHNFAHTHQSAYSTAANYYNYNANDNTVTTWTNAAGAADTILGIVNAGTGAGSAGSVQWSTNQAYYTGGAISAPGGSGASAVTATASVNTTTRTTDVAVDAHAITQPVFTMDNHMHSTSVSFTTGETTFTVTQQPTFTVDAHTHSIPNPGATWSNGAINAAPTTIDIRPKWISAKFYMRIK